MLVVSFITYICIHEVEGIHVHNQMKGFVYAYSIY